MRVEKPEPGKVMMKRIGLTFGACGRGLESPMAENFTSCIQRFFCSDVPIDLDVWSSEISYSIPRKI